MNSVISTRGNLLIAYLLILLLLSSQLVAQQSPQVEITSPPDNTDFVLGDDIQITVLASDSDGSVELVEFYADNEKIGEDATEPFELLWSQPEIGKYDLIATATDNEDMVGTSEKIDVSVNFPEYDYNVNFSSGTSFHTSSFNLDLTTALAGADIWYTLDGSDPLSSTTTQIENAPVQIYIDPQDVSSGRGSTPGVLVRAVVFNGNVQQSWVATKTYLFLEEVRTQSYPGGAWPNWHPNNQILDYSVNQEVVNDAIYGDLIDDALVDIPSISLVTDLENLFDEELGIYVNAEFHGRDWERPVSVELLNPDGSPGFQINAGLRIRGGWSRHHNFPKHAFRLFFREDYGEDRLSFPLFGDEGVDEFRKLDLRTSQNYAWSNGFIYENTMNRDVFSRDLQAELQNPYTRSRYYHLYLNGMYWGLFQSQERPEARFAESYLGGDDDDYDVVKVDVGEDWNLYEIEATDGNLDAWEAVWSASEAGFAPVENYFALEGCLPDGSPDATGTRLVDIDNLIDYMIIIFYTGNFDGPVSKFRGNMSPNNFYAIYNRTANDGFIFLAHDSEHTLLVNPHSPGVGVNEDRVNINMSVDRFETFHPQWLHFKLSESPEYRIRFADRVYKHFNNEGVLQPGPLAEIFSSSAEDIELAIIGESMRWGDLQRSKFNAWEPAINQIINDFFPVRGGIVLDQFETAELYPGFDPPLFKTDGSAITESIIQIQGEISIELELSEGSSGSIIYTLDGTDPRNVGGGFSASAQAAVNHQLINIDATAILMARLYSGGDWSALHELTIYNGGDLSPLRISEIHYHPLDEGATSGKYYEFLEIYNAGPYPLNLSLLTFTNGIEYTFPVGTTLESEDYLVLASNAALFEERYSMSAFDEFNLQLDNSGERVVLETTNADTLINLRYDDTSPWPETADGDGPSLTWTGAAENEDVNDPANWAASSMIHGSPGTSDPVGLNPEQSSLPEHFSLSQNYPNPFNPITSIRYGLAVQTEVSLIVYDLQGREVTTLFSGLKAAGWHTLIWSGRNDAGETISTGLYFLRLEAGVHQSSIKMLYLK
ncbi:MAG: CotH kinase family protein [Candidatus Marinimicrobia bacterium]|nr:CotH kinase family protein [Candidatus Neomarinimicrobiota bacterium]